MTEAELRARLADPRRLARLAPSGSDDAEDLMPARRVGAAVLVPIVLHRSPQSPGVILTLRAATLSAHPGQVSFPGGRIEPGESARAAALREAAEEIGLDPRQAEPIGHLPAHQTGTGYHITPIVALLAPPVSLTPDPAEVAEIFEYPLADLLRPEGAERHERPFRGRVRQYWVWPHPRHHVWGATAAMLRNLALLLRD